MGSLRSSHILTLETVVCKPTDTSRILLRPNESNSRLFSLSLPPGPPLTGSYDLNPSQYTSIYVLNYNNNVLHAPYYHLVTASLGFYLLLLVVSVAPDLQFYSFPPGLLQRASEEDQRAAARHQAAEALRLGEHLL